MNSLNVCIVTTENVSRSCDDDVSVFVVIQGLSCNVAGVKTVLDDKVAPDSRQWIYLSFQPC